MKLRHVVAAVASLSTLSVAGTALAEGPEGGERLPLAQAERTITLPKMVLAPEADLTVPHTEVGTFLNLTIGAAFGVTDDLTVRATVFPFQLTGPGGSGFRYGQISGDFAGPSVGATYHLVKGDIEVGGSLDAQLVTGIPQTSGPVITPGVPVRFHLNKQLRLDTGAWLPMAFLSVSNSGLNLASTSQSSNTVGLKIPVAVLYDITAPIHVGVNSGYAVGDLGHVGDTDSIPLGIFGGYAMAGGKEGPMLDIDPFFAFQSLITPGGASSTDTGNWVLGVNVTGYLYF